MLLQYMLLFLWASPVETQGSSLRSGEPDGAADGGDGSEARLRPQPVGARVRAVASKGASFVEL